MLGLWLPGAISCAYGGSLHWPRKSRAHTLMIAVARVPRCNKIKIIEACSTSHSVTSKLAGPLHSYSSDSKTANSCLVGQLAGSSAIGTAENASVISIHHPIILCQNQMSRRMIREVLAYRRT
ncbi:hypothetical protein M433DRAFT_9676 [Acidomyces richmondensis BFW]|nr:hypothetical protein M433DRAFT_9676 [Acidomyces richmondensis BFW]